jgi:hypothetical protein
MCLCAALGHSGLVPRKLWSGLNYLKLAGKREAIKAAYVAPTYVEADCKVVATMVRASRSINGRIENRSSAYAAA